MFLLSIFTFRSLKLHAILRFYSGIICGPIWGSFVVLGSFAVQSGDHLRSGIICGFGIICGAVGPSNELRYQIIMNANNLVDIAKFLTRSNNNRWLCFRLMWLWLIMPELMKHFFCSCKIDFSPHECDCLLTTLLAKVFHLLVSPLYSNRPNRPNRLRNPERTKRWKTPGSTEGIFWPASYVPLHLLGLLYLLSKIFKLFPIVLVEIFFCLLPALWNFQNISHCPIWKNARDQMF